MIFGGAFLAFILGGVITGSTEPEVQSWGWRIRSCRAGGFALWLRVGMVESDVFTAEDEDAEAAVGADAATVAGGEGAPRTEAAAGAGTDTGAARRDPGQDGLGADSFSARTLQPLSAGLSIVLIFFLVSGVAAKLTWTSYVSRTRRKGQTQRQYWSLVAASCGTRVGAFWGWVSDRVGPKPSSTCSAWASS